MIQVQRRRRVLCANYVTIQIPVFGPSVSGCLLTRSFHINVYFCSNPVRLALQHVSKVSIYGKVHDRLVRIILQTVFIAYKNNAVMRK